MWSAHRSRARSLGLLVLLCLPCLGWGAEAASCQAGWAKVELTPSFPCPRAGYGKRRRARMQRVHGPLYARALVLEGDGQKIALVSVDLGVMIRPLREEVQRQL